MEDGVPNRVAIIGGLELAGRSESLQNQADGLHFFSETLFSSCKRFLLALVFASTIDSVR